MHFRGASSRLFAVVLFLCAVVCAQAAWLAFEHPHSSDHCCQLRHLGPLPFLEPAPVAQFVPVVAMEWFRGSTEIGTAHEALFAAASSRAPPSFFTA
ncbi:MAG TPA: hypothetical protein VMH28_32465 [Candidatus Acidoferrales bacterium]|nr:hypothetical protein [Candidatus Acidoferrales bacterium]